MQTHCTQQQNKQSNKQTNGAHMWKPKAATLLAPWEPFPSQRWGPVERVLERVLERALERVLAGCWQGAGEGAGDARLLPRGRGSGRG